MAEYICSSCGYEGKAKRRKRGSAALEWALWLTLLFPGPLYSIWRRVGVSKECPHCRKETMLALNSSAGWLVKKKMEKDLGLVTPQAASVAAQSSSHPNQPFEEVTKKKPVHPDQW